MYTECRVLSLICLAFEGVWHGRVFMMSRLAYILLHTTRGFVNFILCSEIYTIECIRLKARNVIFSNWKNFGKDAETLHCPLRLLRCLLAHIEIISRNPNI